MVHLTSAKIAIQDRPLCHVLQGETAAVATPPNRTVSEISRKRLFGQLLTTASHEGMTTRQRHGIRQCDSRSARVGIAGDRQPGHVESDASGRQRWRNQGIASPDERAGSATRVRDGDATDHAVEWEVAGEHQSDKVLVNGSVEFTRRTGSSSLCPGHGMLTCRRLLDRCAGQEASLAPTLGKSGRL